MSFGGDGALWELAEPSPLHTSAIVEKCTQKLVDDYNHMLTQATEPLSTFLEYITYVSPFLYCRNFLFVDVRKANGSCQILNMLLMLSSLEMISNAGFLVVKLPKVLFLATHLQRTSELSIRNLPFHC